MNDMINITGGMPVTMSSREIAELTGKRHPDVKRDIERMLSDLSEDVSKFAHIYFDSMNREQHEFRLDRELTETLLLGYSAPLRRKVLARLRELEGIVADPSVALNDPFSLRKLLLDNVEKVLALESKIEADKPKTSFYDAYINADGLYTLQNAARSMNCRPNLFVRWLKQKYMFYQGTALVPRIQYIQAGIFEVKSEIVDDKARPRSYITAKGLEYFTSRVPDEIKAGRAA
ncbi:phage regulatory protein/antirepressor Ant [Rhizobium sp. CNPSo 3968]|uniref:phage regulatory protein/antirepressor Ant n=1 Tax=Rhizobium sp. CNPSo 3968 TaxID=3021408 RepID=UPI00254FE7B4|nr:phage regulatory protein/antirepressor Ant [Rhizobium sp. CNPSo 3968]MDK4720156.1 phage regulatory protein/antirepressor Ant [Rhizobium sp. CNPSo 3968]